MIKNTDIDAIIETGDVEPIQRILENITYSYLERDDIERYTEDGVIKLFKPLPLLKITIKIKKKSLAPIPGRKLWYFQ